MLEKTVEAYLVERVRALGGTAYKFTSPARASVPDRIVVLPPGRIFFIEVKRPGGKLTRGQERGHEHLRRLGADVRVLDSIGAINAFLNEVETAPAVPGHVRFSMESTARWLEGGCDPLAAAKEIRACLAKLDAAPAAPVATWHGINREAVQRVAIEHGFVYWRAPDAHGVKGTIQQATGLLQYLLAVEVEINPDEPECATCNGNGMIGGQSFYAPDEGGVPCPDCAQAVAADGAVPQLGQPDTNYQAPYAGHRMEFHSRDQIIEYGNARARAAVSPATAESKCTRCGSSTAQACNELGCFYLESGEGEPAASSAEDDVGNWLWSELMDYCRERGIAPATAGRLFQIVSRARAKFAPQPAQAAAPAEARPTDDALWDQTLRERDEYHETADKLAAAIAKYLGVDIGEHSNLNCPWDQALDAIENARPVVPADAGEAVAHVVAALRKLVHLKSLKDGADRCVPGYIEDRIEYQRDKPKAWDDARAALASFDAAQGAKGGKGGEA